MAMGPVQLLVVGFDGPQLADSTLAALDRLRDGDAVRLVDVLVVRKDADGSVEPAQPGDPAGGATVAALIGLVEGAGEDAAGEGDVWCVDDAIPNGWAAAIALVEHRWAVGFGDAIRDAGGVYLADAWVQPADLVAIGLMTAEEADARSAPISRRRPAT
jgi:Family of unknown function (DUF6325)